MVDEEAFVKEVAATEIAVQRRAQNDQEITDLHNQIEDVYVRYSDAVGEALWLAELEKLANLLKRR